MLRLLNLQSAVQGTVAALVRLEESLAKDPRSPALNLMGRSLRNQYEQLQADFLAEAARQETDVCTYRMFTVIGSARYTVNEVTTTLRDFQQLFTTVYRALRPRTTKQRAEIIENSEFGVAYTFPGSFGVTLTLPRERQLFDSGREFDEAMQTVFGMATARTADDILRYVRNIGPTAIRQMDKWASDHTEHGLGADIGWKIQTATPARLFIQPPEIKSLRNAISLSAYSAPREIEIVGTLVGADMDRKSFHFKTETRQDIYGRFSDAITSEHRAQLPAPYSAKLRVTTQTLYATEQEEDTHFLLSLKPRDARETEKQ